MRLSKCRPSQPVVTKVDRGGRRGAESTGHPGGCEWGKWGERMRQTGEGPKVENDNVRVLRTDEVAEERDLVGVYLHEISRTPLLDAAQEVDLSKAIETGLYA